MPFAAHSRPRYAPSAPSFARCTCAWLVKANGMPWISATGTLRPRMPPISVKNSSSPLCSRSSAPGSEPGRLSFCEEVVVAEMLLAVGRHVLPRRARLHGERHPGKKVRQQPRPGAALAALADGAVAAVALVLQVRLLAALCGASRRILSEKHAGEEQQDQKSHQRPCVTTSTSAGSPRFTTATARCSAGAIAAGSVIGPSAHTPCARASSA